MERILVGVDPARDAAGGPAAQWAADRARAAAERGDPARVLLATAVDLLAADLAAAEHVLLSARRRILAAAPGTEVEAHLVDSPVAEGLAGLARAADLLVLGCRADVGGALAAGGLAAGPVVLVPEGWRPRPGPVVVGIPDDESANRAVLYAAREAGALGTDLDVVHAWQLPLPVDPHEALVVEPDVLRAAHRAIMGEALARVRAAFPRARVRGILATGPAGATLTAHAEGARLVVLGAHAVEGRGNGIAGPTAHALLGAAAAPVCVVPPARAGVPLGARP